MPAFKLVLQEGKKEKKGKKNLNKNKKGKFGGGGGGGGSLIVKKWSLAELNTLLLTAVELQSGILPIALLDFDGSSC